MKSKLRGLMIGIIVSILITGCVEKTQQDESSVNTSTSLFFPVQKYTNPSVRMTAILEGELVQINGCLRVDKYLLVWPYGFSISTNDEVIQINNNTGKPVAIVGDKVILGGGEIPGDYIANFSRELPSSRCSGPYWIVGDVSADR
ncbi:MAG: hypothetical protein KKG76_09430 [Euryarchaeota archaeon]|nr:hypothetical protein [Euryarchaeota archaeon]